MGYWGWRPFLLVFISVLIVSCNTNPPSLPPTPPTEYPLITLTVRTRPSPAATESPNPSNAPTQPHFIPEKSEETPVYVYVVQQDDTLRTIAHLFDTSTAQLRSTNALKVRSTLIPGQSLIISNPGNAPPGPTRLLIDQPLSPPACLFNALDNLICMGIVRNTGDAPIGQARVQVQVWSLDGTLLAVQSVQTARRTIEPGEETPYRAQFSGIMSDEIQAMALLVTHLPDNRRVIHLETIAEDEVVIQPGAGIYDTYIVDSQIHNPMAVDASAIRAVLTVYNQHGEITGFRTVDVDSTLPPGKAMPLHIEAYVQGKYDRLTHTLHVEARQPD